MTMSDCSTNAMKPKALYLHECVYCEHYCAECDKCCKGVPDHQDCMFRCWKPSRAYKSEQRYQQLEQVAWDMWSLIKNIEREYSRLLDPNRGLAPQTIRFPPSVEFAERLKEIGVSIDG